MNVPERDNPTLCVVDGNPVTLGEIAPVLKVEGRWSLVEEAVREAVLEAAVAARGITVSDQELQLASNRLRAEHGLHRAADMRAWLRAQHLSAEDLEKGLARGLTVAKLRAGIDEDEVRGYFFDHLKQFQWVRFAQLVAADRDTAAELLAQLRDGEGGFARLARRHSIDPDSAPAGGYVGGRSRSELSPALEALAFAAPLGEVAGPIEIDVGWCLIEVWDRGGGAYDDATAARARDAVFEQWLERQIEQARVEIRL